MATALSAALEPFPYNSEINNGASQQRAWQQPLPTSTPQNHPVFNLLAFTAGSKAWLKVEYTNAV